MATKKFKFKNPNTGIVEERPDTPYFRNLAKKIQEKYNKLSDKDKAAIKTRIQKREARQADTDKKKQEVKKGRAAGLSMTEIRAKRMNISADELNKKQLATLLNMAAGMSTFLPAGAAIKAGQLVYKGMKGAKAAKAIRAAANANKTSKTTKPATKTQVIEGKAIEKSSKPVRTTKPSTDKKPSTAVTKKPRTDVKKPGTGVMEIRPGAKPKRGMKTVTGTDKTRDLNKIKSNIKAAQRAGNASKVEKLVAAALAAGLVTSAAVLTGKKPGPSVASVTKPKPPTSKPKRAGRPPLGGPSDGRKKGPPTGRPPLGGPSDGTKKKKKSMPKPGDRASNRTSFNAGRDVGFGPKGNIFPSNDAERAALMKMYGGTGSKAGKAAQAGTQGDLVAGRVALKKAKRERLKGKK